VALYNLMEDAATAEISRTQVWQWLHNEVVIEGGRTFNMTLYKDILMMKKIITEFYEENIKNSKFELAIELLIS
jgi:malate synthase